MTMKTSYLKYQQDLEWFFWQGESACGVHSNYVTLFQALLYSLTSDEAEVIDQQTYSQMAISQASAHHTLESIGKYRRILRRYQQLSSSSKLILEKYYEERQFHPEMAGFGPGINLIPLTELGREMELQFLRDPGTKLLAHFKSIKKGLKKQVNEIYLTALQEYVELP